MGRVFQAGLEEAAIFLGVTLQVLVWSLFCLIGIMLFPILFAFELYERRRR